LRGWGEQQRLFIFIYLRALKMETTKQETKDIAVGDNNNQRHSFLRRFG
jgi:hypothetical protein